RMCGPTPNSDTHQEETKSRVHNSSSTILPIYVKPKSCEDKEMDNFLVERHNEQISNEIRERNQEKKLQRESTISSGNGQAEISELEQDD
ncbi:18386_t:CDS:1, partial [Acaulospora morrowiae]